MLRELGERHPARIDWLGNLTLRRGLPMLLTGVSYGIKPYGSSSMGWSDPFVLGMMAGGAAALIVFVLIELHITEPMFNLRLLRIRAFAAGNWPCCSRPSPTAACSSCSSCGYRASGCRCTATTTKTRPCGPASSCCRSRSAFSSPGPVSGRLSDRHGARPFATGGMLLAAATFIGLLVLPADFMLRGVRAVLFSTVWPWACSRRPIRRPS